MSKQESSKRRILITGGTGYVGSVFVSQYAAEHPSDQLVVVARSPKQRIFPSNVSIELADYGDRQKMEQIMRENYIDTVVHIAAELDNDASESNVTKSKALFEAMDAAKVDQIIYSSTFMVYQYPPADSSGKLSEDSEVKAASVENYPESKRAVEEMLLAKKAWRSVILRFAIVIGSSGDLAFGDTRPKQGIVSTYVGAARNSSVVTMPDDGSAARDFVDVQDVASAIDKSLVWTASQQSPASVVLNVGSGRTHTINELIQAVESAAGVRVQANRSANLPIVPVSFLDASMIKKVLHWEPKVEFGQSIKNALRFAERQTPK